MQPYPRSESPYRSDEFQCSGLARGRLRVSKLFSSLPIRWYGRAAVSRQSAVTSRRTRSMIPIGRVFIRRSPRRLHQRNRQPRRRRGSRQDGLANQSPPILRGRCSTPSRGNGAPILKVLPRKGQKAFPCSFVTKGSESLVTPAGAIWLDRLTNEPRLSSTSTGPMRSRLVKAAFRTTTGALSRSSGVAYRRSSSSGCTQT
jgi:hypothetical protein